MRSVFTILIILLSVLLISACGGDTAAGPGDGLQVSLATQPDPPASGDIELIVTVNDAAGQPISEAEVNLKTDHTEMSGMSMEGPATAQGNGRYAIVAPFEHGGRWQITVQIKQAGQADFSQDFELQVQ